MIPTIERIQGDIKQLFGKELAFAKRRGMADSELAAEILAILADPHYQTDILDIHTRPNFVITLKKTGELVAKGDLAVEMMRRIFKIPRPKPQK